MANGVFAGDQLRIFVERIERLEEEKKGITDDIKDVKAEAKAAGFDVPTMIKCIALRKLETAVRQEQESLLDVYKAELGLSFDSTPLGAAVDKLDELADESGGSITIKTGDGATIAEFGEAAKKKRGRPKKVRDPSDGSESLVTVPEKQVA